MHSIDKSWVSLLKKCVVQDELTKKVCCDGISALCNIVAWRLEIVDQHVQESVVIYCVDEW